MDSSVTNFVIYPNILIYGRKDLIAIFFLINMTHASTNNVVYIGDNEDPLIHFHSADTEIEL